MVPTQKNVSNNWWKCPARPWELHYTCAENLFENEAKFSEQHCVFHLFVAQRGKKLLTKFFLHCWQKIAFCVSRAQHQFDVFWSLFSFFTNFDLWELNFHTQSEKCSAQLSKLQFRCTDDNLMNSWISAEKCNCFSNNLSH